MSIKNNDSRFCNVNVIGELDKRNFRRVGAGGGGLTVEGTRENAQAI